jgi:hypothetical protein
MPEYLYSTSQEDKKVRKNNAKRCFRFQAKNFIKSNESSQVQIQELQTGSRIKTKEFMLKHILLKLLEPKLK